MVKYCIRRNPATGRWVMYYLARRHVTPVHPCWQIFGSADTQAHAIDAVFS